ncbi:MAG TPA: sigma-70 family RNA polymerase sigma factor [Solirubrobacterales bacterium]
MDDARQPLADAARKRAAVETYARHETTLRRTATRYSICADDAEEALQRTLEILLRKAPSEDPRELIRWTQTVVKHEALAVRKDRERILSGPAALRPEPGREDWVALIPTETAGPPERAERREAIARSREALQALKPQELRALGLLAEGYSYVEISQITGFSRTKINRCLAEGRERFRRIVARSEDGRRCAEMGPLLSAFCDDEAEAGDATAVREHLRACPHCRATLRAYRAAPAAAAALAPLLPLQRPLLERAHDALAGFASRFGGAGSSDSTLQQVASSGGTRGAGLAALAKLTAVCLGTVGGAAACVATGVVPAPIEIGHAEEKAASIERPARLPLNTEASESNGVQYETAPPPALPQPEDPPRNDPPPPEPEPAPIPEATAGAVEYAPPPPASTPPPSSSGSGGDPAGEFGP